MYRMTVMLLALLTGISGPQCVLGQEEAAGKTVRGSLVEERAAAKLLEAGQARYDANEAAKAVEIWQSVTERYPRSRARFDAHMLLGNYYLGRERAYERARVHFEVAAAEANRDQAQRAEAILRMGACFHHLRNYSKCFQVMREIIDKFPGSPQVNEAYYYIGLGHFQLGHYSRAIAALENVGTTMTGEKDKVEKVEAGKRLFVRIEDADLAVLDPSEALPVRCESGSGDVETVRCFPLGRGARSAMGSLPTRLGKPVSGNGVLEVKGDDKVKIVHIDQHTAEKALDRKVERQVEVVGSATVRITDGAFREILLGAVLGKELNVQVADADRDVSDKADTVKARVVVYRPKSEAEVEAETVQAAANSGDAGPAADENGKASPKVDPLKEIDRVEIALIEAKNDRQELDSLGSEVPPADGAAEKPAAQPAEKTAEKPALPAEKPVAATVAATDDSVHTGVFRATVLLEKAEQAVAGDDKLQALPGDTVRVLYVDEKHRGDGAREVTAQAPCLEGNIGTVRISQAVISDQELRIQIRLKTASALTNIGNRYKEFGLKKNADEKYKQAMVVCDEIMGEARNLRGRVLEETYVQLWRIYFEMEQLNLAAAMCQRLQKQFPASGFVDEAMLQLAEVARKQGDLPRAIHLYSGLTAVKTSLLRGEAQFGIAQCYEQMAKDAEGGPGARARVAAMQGRAFQEYKNVLDRFPQSGRVGDAVAKMADYYYEHKDYARAIEVFETVLSQYPDARFLDVVLFNYGRCLYRLGRKSESLAKFNQLMAEFPGSPLAADAKKITEAMREPAAGEPAPAAAKPAEE